ncbi:MAG: peptide chain release factor 2 [Candidatus Omnitrophota bacterium]|jgi:peptide chain release factor 2
MGAPDFWSSGDQQQEIIQSMKSAKAQYDPLVNCESKVNELKELLEMVEADDIDSIKAVTQDAASLVKILEKMEFQKLLGGEADRYNAIVSVNAGAGGTESCDWASMLIRMYKRWADDQGHSVEEVDVLAGESAGIKNATFIIRGSYAYGYLKGENGVHRLVRISPFDSNKRRHTSFASVEVIPEVEDDIEIEVNPADLRIDTYRSGGAGGQHVNVTDSAVRITHIPTGIVVQCQNERSQHKNRASCMKMLKSKLYNAELMERQEKLSAGYASKNKIEWGSQIRSYVLHPYNMVKDHRTSFETSDAHGVLEGVLNGFLESSLKFSAKAE